MRFDFGASVGMDEDELSGEMPFEREGFSNAAVRSLLDLDFRLLGLGEGEGEGEETGWPSTNPGVMVMMRGSSGGCCCAPAESDTSDPLRGFLVNNEFPVNDLALLDFLGPLREEGLSSSDAGSGRGISRLGGGVAPIRCGLENISMDC